MSKKIIYHTKSNWGDGNRGDVWEIRIKKSCWDEAYF